LAESLTEEEYFELCDALEDGFPDMLGRKMSFNKQNRGNLFSTNPLGEEVTFFMASEDVPSELTQTERSLLKEASGDFYLETDSFREYFSLNPFGFNFEKVKLFFDRRVEAIKPSLKEKYNEYLCNAELIPDEFLANEPGYPDVFDGIYSFPQWLENILVPYSKTWFEDEISRLLRLAKYKEESFNEPNEQFEANEWAIAPAIEEMRILLLVGRMVEHYKWKFRFESALVSRKQQFERAGSGGGSTSKAKRIQRLNDLMTEIETFADHVDKFGENLVLRQAWENLSKRRSDIPKTPKIRAEYEADLRSCAPFRERYEALFPKNA